MSQVDTTKKMSTLNSALIIISVVLVSTLAILTWVWHSSTCSVEDCTNVSDNLTYAEAVDNLQKLLEDNPENQQKFIKNFFKQLKNTCVASA